MFIIIRIFGEYFKIISDKMKYIYCDSKLQRFHGNVPSDSCIPYPSIIQILPSNQIHNHVAKVIPKRC